MTQADVPFFIGAGGTYSSSDGLCLDAIDPLTVVIRRNGAETVEHVSHHGVSGAPPATPEPLTANALGQPWLDSLEGRQHFTDLFGCVWGEVSRGTNDGRDDCGDLLIVTWCAESRWHVRCNVVESVADPAGGTFAACTPHWDQDEGGYLDAFGQHGCWHAVPRVFGDSWDGPGGFPNNVNASGFTAGREYMRQLLVVQGDHRSLGVFNYGNDVEQPQCNGDLTASDGFVEFIEVLP